MERTRDRIESAGGFILNSPLRNEIYRPGWGFEPPVEGIQYEGLENNMQYEEAF